MSTELFVYSMTRVGAVGAWSRYVIPMDIDDWVIRGEDLYIRAGDNILVLDETAIGDEVSLGVVQNFPGLIQWPWLDFGQPGATKMLYGFDMVGNGDVSVQFGYDQTNGGVFTDAYKVPGDTVPGMVIPMPLAAPSLSVRLTFDGSQDWQWNAFCLYLQDLRGMA
ncbi:hypothetical protein [Xanthomonas campestris]|uniref:hypothetical protein n=1 Tax=Xanthomonas campestris TaxID=339 RepID=UPI00128FD83E|nr:hypothetical protein [Xanthomonas campestris]